MSKTNVLTHLAGVLGLLLISAQALQAQVRILGRVVEEGSGGSVSGARVTFRNGVGRAILERLTDSLGAFELSTDGVASGTLQAERVGYRSATTPMLDLSGSGSHEIELRLAPEPFALDPLEVAARTRSASPVLEGFYDRLEGGLGFYLTRQDVDRRRPLLVSDLLTAVPGVRLESGGGGRRRIATMSRASGRCAAQIFVDGMHMTRWPGSVSVDDVATPGVIEGIEIYTGAARVPAEFRTAGVDCGVIAIWTRRGDVSSP